MKREWPHYAILRAASFLAPPDQRAEWLEEWRSEFWYIDRRRAALFCLGAFPDALWLRRNNSSPETPAMIRLESPLGCLTFLATLAAVCIFFAARLPSAREIVLPSALTNGTSVVVCLATALFARLLLPAITVRAMAKRHTMPWTGWLRRWIFLVLKIALVLPVIFCGLLFFASIAPVIPLAPSLGFCATFMLAFRWVMEDQRRRCPVCLRLLSHAVRVGSASQTFLEWYGAESMCPCGHGLLHVPEIASSCYGKQEWLCLGSSWSDLFTEAAGVRQR